MKPTWPLRQLLAILRGIALIVAMFWVLLLVQFVPALLRGGLTGVRDFITQAAIAGVPPEHWDIAILRMYEALAATLLFGIVLYLGQRYLGRKLAAQNSPPRRM